MRILLTNDDGIMAPGIVAMYRELVNLGDVTVVAPETVQSATGHGITLTTPLLTNRVTIENAFTGTAVDGRPADCVKLAINQLLPEAPDLVISGMNSGANVGINVLYSGTVAAAIEAAFLGLPSVAVSLHLRAEVPTDYRRAARLALDAIRLVLDNGLARGEMANVNVPALLPHEEPAGVKVVRQCTRGFIDMYEKRTDPRGREYFWNSSVFSLGDTEDDTDVAALRDKYICITPLQFDLTHHAMARRWGERKWAMPAR
ncbi:MAG TPA: 5'/3'-nucleotidase SurE [Tepidisphaeraceae bacterium]|nr:5'/3'-nucleotidase SurE [Tepidisphaeraceae bacterium]